MVIFMEYLELEIQLFHSLSFIEMNVFLCVDSTQKFLKVRLLFLLLYDSISILKSPQFYDLSHCYYTGTVVDYRTHYLYKVFYLFHACFIYFKSFGFHFLSTNYSLETKCIHCERKNNFELRFSAIPIEFRQYGSTMGSKRSPSLCRCGFESQARQNL